MLNSYFIEKIEVDFYNGPCISGLSVQETTDIIKGIPETIVDEDVVKSTLTHIMDIGQNGCYENGEIYAGFVKITYEIGSVTTKPGMAKWLNSSPK